MPSPRPVVSHTGAYRQTPDSPPASLCSREESDPDSTAVSSAGPTEGSYTGRSTGAHRRRRTSRPRRLRRARGRDRRTQPGPQVERTRRGNVRSSSWLASCPTPRQRTPDARTIKDARRGAAKPRGNARSSPRGGRGAGCVGSNARWSPPNLSRLGRGTAPTAPASRSPRRRSALPATPAAVRRAWLLTFRVGRAARLRGWLRTRVTAVGVCSVPRLVRLVSCRSGGVAMVIVIRPGCLRPIPVLVPGLSGTIRTSAAVAVLLRHVRRFVQHPCPMRTHRLAWREGAACDSTR